MHVRHIKQIGFIASLVIASLCGRGSGQVLDQSQDVLGGSARLREQSRYAQTFTPAISGQLESIWLFSNNAAAQSFVGSLSIHGTTAGGAPTDTPLATSTFSWGPRFGFFKVPLESLDLDLQAGTTYAFSVTNNDPAPNLTVYGDEIGIDWHGNKYAGGELWRAEGGSAWAPFNSFGTPGLSDMTFRTFMVPEPAAASLLLAAAVPALLRRSRARRNRR